MRVLRLSLAKREKSERRKEKSAKKEEREKEKFDYLRVLRLSLAQLLFSLKLYWCGWQTAVYLRSLELD